MTNYTIIQNETITSYLSDKAFRLYSLLQSMCYNDKISCYPSQSYLACALRCSVRTIQRALKELRDNKLITIARRGSTSNLYTLIQKKINNTIDRLKRAVQNHVTGSDVKDAPIQGNQKQDTVNRENAKNKKPKNYYKKKTEHFNDYTQRKYDYSKLEKGLLGEEDFEFNDLLLE